MSNKQFDQRTATNSSSTKDVAADQAKNVAQNAQQKGQHVAESAKGEAQQLAGEAKGQAQDLFHQVRSEATSQVSTQQQRLAGSLRSMSQELDKMAHGADSGTASGLVSQAAGQVDQVAGWLENREPADLLTEVRRYARRNPTTFLAGAALLGLVGGRLTRGLQADNQRQQGAQRGYAGYQGQTGYPAQGGYEGQGYGYVERTPDYGYRAAHAQTGPHTGYAAPQTAGYTDAPVYDQEASAPYAGEAATYVSDGETAERRGQDRPGTGEARR